MSALLEDFIHHDHYFGPTTGAHPIEPVQLEVYEWHPGQPRERTRKLLVSSAAELFARDSEVDCKLRIVLAPSAPPERAFQAICRYYDVPSSFMSEYSTSPPFSFGQGEGISSVDVKVSWARFLCKDVLSPSIDPKEGGEIFYDNFLWIKCISFLHVRRLKDESKRVTMICFGAPLSIEQRFDRLLGAATWEDAVREPYILFAIVYEQFFLLLDQAAWTLAGWFRPLERSTLECARLEASGGGWRWPMDFAKLHDIGKHGIYLSEAATAAVLAVESVISHLHDPSHRPTVNPLTQAAISHLQYQLRAFRSTQLRLSSLDKRIANVISLSFNLVTQRDSRVLTADSNAMKAIALLTLIFLPMTGVASLFDTPFFEASSGNIRVASSFWIFWVITLCLTLVLVSAWLWWYKAVKQRLFKHKSI